MDADGRACSFGSASREGAIGQGTVVVESPTTFYDNAVHGLALETQNGRSDVYETRNGLLYGKVTQHTLGDNPSIVNHLWSVAGQKYVTKTVSASEAFYNSDASIGTALDSDWFVNI